MHITRIYIKGFKRFEEFDLELDPNFNVIVGDNETGKSSLLEAIALVLTGQYEGRLIQYALDPYLFNATNVGTYFAKQRNGEHIQPPEILIEAYLDEDVGVGDPELSRLKGTNNTRGEDCPGLVMRIEVDDDNVELLKEYAGDDTNPEVLPIEFFRATWRSFSDDVVTLRKLPFRAVTIDTNAVRVHRGPNKYLSQVVNDVLSDSDRRELGLQYKKIRHGFAQDPRVRAINEHLEQQGNPGTRKKLSIQMDMSSRATWDSATTPHLDDLPFDCAGRGEQCRVQMRLAIAGADKSRVILIDEPENHLSHSNLNALLADIRNDCTDRQVVVTTHSAFVLNKLGIENLRLLSATAQPIALTGLTDETRRYFMRLPGYDTLRLILAERAILVEGPSDELIVQRAYKERHGRLPIEDGVDVISVGALAFKRFLEIAALLKLHVRVVTDNDGDVAALRVKYSQYFSGSHAGISICYDDDENTETLEPQLLKANSRAVLNAILGTKHEDDASLLKYMGKNKTDCALKLFETTHAWTTPSYIGNAVA
jgi:putative ATP-dependent endonuclease of the OLD family